MADNPFTEGHRDKAAKELADAVKREHDATIERATAKGKVVSAPKPQPKVYVVRPFWEP